MSIDHNRIKVADLEKGPEGTFLAPKSDGTLEFREIYTGLDCDIEGQVLDARQGKELKNYADAKVADAIVPGATDVAPSQNAVSDALDLKVDKGGGIANYVPKWNALLGLTNSQIFDNGTNVCIGTTNPFATYKTTTYQNSGGNIATFGYNGQTKIPKIGIQATADDEIGFNSDNSDHTVALTWIHNTNEVMRIAQNGSLLINTTIDNGVDKLQVNGSVNAKSFTAKQSGEANTVNLFKIIPSTIGNETYGLDFNSYPNSGGGAGTYNHGAWLGYNTGFHSLAPTTIGKPSIMIGLEDNYFDNSGDGLFGKEFYVQGFSPDGTTVQMSRPFYARGNQDNSGLDWWTIISNIGMNGNNRQFTVKAGNNALLNITPTRTTSYVELEANSLFSANSTILMNNEQYFQIKNSTGSGVSIMKVDSTNDMYLGDIFGGLRDIYFRNNGVSSVILKNNGNVLIGSPTDNGVDKLQVSGSIKVTLDSTINGLTIGIGNFNNASNTALGYRVLRSSIDGIYNTGVGENVLQASTHGSWTTAMGCEALFNHISGNFVTGVGFQVLYNNTNGSGNTAFGHQSLYGNTNGSYNVAQGYLSGSYLLDGTTTNTSSNNSLFIGANTKSFASAQTNEIVIGYNASGIGSNSVVLGNDSVIKTALKGNVLVGTTTDNGVDKLQVNGYAVASGYKVPSGMGLSVLLDNGTTKLLSDFTPGGSYVTTNTNQTKTGVLTFDNGANLGLINGIQTNAGANASSVGAVFNAGGPGGTAVQTNIVGAAKGYDITNAGAYGISITTSTTSSAGSGLLLKGNTGSSAYAIRSQNNGADTFLLNKEGNIIAASFSKSGATSTDALMGDGNTKVLSSGTYTPTITLPSGLTGYTLMGTPTYSRVGNIVTVMVSFLLNASAAVGFYNITITLPISRATSNPILIGSAGVSGGTQLTANAQFISSSTTTGLLSFSKTSSVTEGFYVPVIIQYDVTQ